MFKIAFMELTCKRRRVTGATQTKCMPSSSLETPPAALHKLACFGRESLRALIRTMSVNSGSACGESTEHRRRSPIRIVS